MIQSLKKNRKIWITIIFAILLVGLVALMLYLNSVREYKSEVNKITVSDVDLNKIPDGTYNGDCNVNFIYAKVAVTVKNGVIENIALLEHKNGKGKPAEKIIDDMVDQQKIDVDAVSGATNSSKVIKKAVENALLSAK